ncbi:MAG: hypothetical protein HYS27_12315 [Deltaproteobacteria bacterium]|nr:hypothetical protein [Deltaproteobacteria bacterium]
MHRLAACLGATLSLTISGCLADGRDPDPQQDAGAPVDAGDADRDAGRIPDVPVHRDDRPPPVPAEPVVCSSPFPHPVTAGGPIYDVLPLTRQLNARSMDPEGEVTLHFTDGFFFVYRFDQDAPPQLPDLGPVDFLSYAGQCGGEACDTTFHALEAPGVGRFLEYGFFSVVDGNNLEHRVAGSLFLQLRYGTPEDVCADGGGEVPAVLQAVTDDGVLDLLPGQQLDANVDGNAWRVRSGPARRVEYVDQSGCDGCPPYVVHTESSVTALAYRRAP